MLIHLNQVLNAFSMGLDAVESDFLGASTHHGPRIATLSMAMGRHLGLSEGEITTLGACALLHDNALTEYILSERPGTSQDFNMKSHCTIGERNAAALPFPTDSRGLILYHHEQADGNGPFGKREGEIPVDAALIAIADMLDVKWHLQTLTPEDLPALREFIASQAGGRYMPMASDALLAVLDESMLVSLRDEAILETFFQAMPDWSMDLSPEEIIRLASFAARIIDYKSEFTQKHSVQIANIAWQMGCFYGCDQETQAKLYLAGSLHDIGKLYIPTDILEKPGPLTDAQFDIIKTHIDHTHNMLSRIEGFEDISQWACNHHEKLDGSGYANHKTGEELDHFSRLLTCIDIYQAVSAKRPYHEMRSHRETIDLMRDMAKEGLLDAAIVEDLNEQMACYPNEEVPPPKTALV